MPDGQGKEQQNINPAPQQKRPQIQRHRGVIGPHPQTQQGVGKGVPKPLRGEHQPGDAPRQGDGHRDGKGPDHQGQVELQGAHRHAAQTPEEQPAGQFRRDGSVDSGQFAGDHKEHPDGRLGQKRHPRRQDELGQIQVPGGDRGSHGLVPVVVRVLQPPLPGAEHPQLGGEEKQGGKQHVLGPKAVPLALQHLQIAQIVDRPQDGRKQGEHHEGQPHRAPPALHQLRPNGTQQHNQTSFRTNRVRPTTRKTTPHTRSSPTSRGSGTRQ